MEFEGHGDVRVEPVVTAAVLPTAPTLASCFIVGTAAALRDVPLVVGITVEEQIGTEALELQVAYIEQLDVSSDIVEHALTARWRRADARATRAAQRGQVYVDMSGL